MKNLRKTISVLLAMICLMMVVYTIFLRPYILTWGATDAEIEMPLLGDSLTDRISATRAITIDRPAAKVWYGISQIGSDREGFYSYEFIENLFGCEMSTPDSTWPDIEIGRYVPIVTVDENGEYSDGFYVIALEPERSFVLDRWGTFLVEANDDKSCRLIIRTEDTIPNSFAEHIKRFFFDPAHYFMERRMFLGIKGVLESEDNTDPLVRSDPFWFAALLLSGIGIILIAIFQHRPLDLIPVFLNGLLWLLTFIILPPLPLYGGALLLITAISLWYLLKQGGSVDS